MRIALATFVASVLLPFAASAQVVVPAVGSNSLFEPEIDIVNSGAKLDVQATVSADRKYVTMTLRPQNAQLLALRTFAFQTGTPVAGGTVGGVSPVVAGAVIPAVPNAPMRVAAGKGGVILMQRGITPLVLKD